MHVSTDTATRVSSTETAAGECMETDAGESSTEIAAGETSTQPGEVEYSEAEDSEESSIAIEQQPYLPDCLLNLQRSAEESTKTAAEESSTGTAARESSTEMAVEESFTETAIRETCYEVERMSKPKTSKPKRLCLFCNKFHARLPRHILTQHKEHPMVAPLLVMNRKEQIFQISNFRRQAIKEHNLKECNKGTANFIRERVSKTSDSDAPPFMCSGCEAFISQNYISRHKRFCVATGHHLAVPMLAMDCVKSVALKDLDEDFKALLNKLKLDEVGNYVKSDEIILMIGVRSFKMLKKKKRKKDGNKENCSWTYAVTGENVSSVQTVMVSLLLMSL